MESEGLLPRDCSMAEHQKECPDMTEQYEQAVEILANSYVELLHDLKLSLVDCPLAGYKIQEVFSKHFRELLQKTYPGSDMKVLAVRAKNQPENFRVGFTILAKNADEKDTFILLPGKEAGFVKVVEK